MRLPHGVSFVQWKTQRCSMYSANVHAKTPPRRTAAIARGRQVVPQGAAAEEERGDRDPHDERRRRVDAREALEEVALEHPARVARVGASATGRDGGRAAATADVAMDLSWPWPARVNLERAPRGRQRPRPRNGW